MNLLILLVQSRSEIRLGDTQPGFGVNFKTTKIDTVISSAIFIVMVVGVLGVLAMMLWGGIDWIFSGGDKEKLASARKKITTAIIGLILLALAFLILQIFGAILGFNFFADFPIPDFNGNNVSTQRQPVRFGP